MKKRILLFTIFLVLLVSGCQETVYKESKKVSDNKGNFEFTLNTSIPVYDVELQVRYTTLRKGVQTFDGDIISPSGEKYHDWTHLGSTSSSRGSSLLDSLYFNNVKSEDGKFSISFEVTGVNKVIIKQATLKIKRGKE